MVPVLLLHGSGPGTTAAAWNPLVDAFDGRFRVIAPDLPGFGAEPKGARPLDEWALDLVDEPCAVVGNSAGGALALMLAARKPELVTKVVAVGSMGYPMPLPAGLDALWDTGATEPEARALLDLLFYDPPGDEAVAARLQAMRAQPHYRELFPAPRRPECHWSARNRQRASGFQSRPAPPPARHRDKPYRRSRRPWRIGGAAGRPWNSGSARCSRR